MDEKVAKTAAAKAENNMAKTTTGLGREKPAETAVTTMGAVTIPETG